MSDTKTASPESAVSADQDATLQAVADSIDDTVAEALAPPEFEVSVTHDKVSVLLSCADPLSDLDANVSKVHAALVELELPEFPDQEILTTIMQNICTAGDHLRDRPIIMGQAPVDPVDGRLEWARDFFAEGWVTDEESGSVNFWEKMEKRSVKEDELLVQLHPSVSGEAGLSVFGNKIAVAKPTKARLRCGKGVKQIDAEDGIVSYFAACDGRVRYTDGTIAVDDVYVIKGNVSLETGNIQHTGAVMIEGDIGAGAKVEAEGDVVVKGMTEPATITTGGTLTVAGGIVGDENHVITAGGGVQAKYIGEAVIRAQGDIAVTNEIAHSNIQTRGKVEVVNGRIAGGVTVARMGIKVAEAGASGSADTTLIAGIDYTLHEQVAEHKAKIKKLEAAQEKIAEAIRSAHQRGDALSDQDRKVVAGLEQKSRQMQQAISDVHEQIKRLTDEALAGAVREVVMLQEVWSGTRIHLGDYKTAVRSSVLKPRIAKLKEKKVRILPLGDGNMPNA